MLNETQKAALSAPLSSTRVKSRKQAGRDLSYIEGWWAISEANRIFGFDGWDRQTVRLKQLGDAREVDGKVRVAYMAMVRIIVKTWRSTPNGDEVDGVLREGTGYGSGIDRDLGQAHESAIKEAETDAMKRALMTFGNPFGLALYDKEQNGVTDDAPQPSAAAPKTPYEDPDGQMKAWCDAQKTFLTNCEEISDVQAWEELRADALSRLRRKHVAAWADLQRFKENRIGNINLKPKAAAE